MSAGIPHVCFTLIYALPKLLDRWNGTIWNLQRLRYDDEPEIPKPSVHKLLRTLKLVQE
jgi:hypothetical protein